MTEDNDEPCMCGTPFTCMADDHDAAVAIGVARAEAAVTERARWEKALANSKLPNLYVRLVRRDGGQGGVVTDWRWLAARLMHALGRHDPYCRGVVGLSCDPIWRPELWR